MVRPRPSYGEVLIVYNSDDPYGDGRGEALANYYSSVRGPFEIMGAAFGSSSILSDEPTITAAFDLIASHVTSTTKYVFLTGIDTPRQFRASGYIQGFDHLDIMLGYVFVRNGSGKVTTPYYGNDRITVSAAFPGRSSNVEKAFIGGNYYEQEVSPEYNDPFGGLSGSDALTSGTERKLITGFIGGARGFTLETSIARIDSCLSVESSGGLSPQDGVVYVTMVDRLSKTSFPITTAAYSAVKGFTVERGARVLEALGYTVKRYVRSWDSDYTDPQPASDFDLGIVDNGGAGGAPTMPSGPLNNVLFMIGTGIANNPYSTFPKPFNWLPGSFWIEPTSSLAGRAVDAMNAGLCCAQGAWMEPYANGVPDAGRCIELLLRGYRWCEVFPVCTQLLGKTDWYGDPLYQPFDTQEKMVNVPAEVLL